LSGALSIRGAPIGPFPFLVTTGLDPVVHAEMQTLRLRSEDKEVQAFQDGEQSKLVPMQTAGRYALLVGSESIDVYVLREILQSA
jgi:hypothetical protein